DDVFINARAEQRAARAAKLLEALAELEDPQVCKAIDKRFSIDTVSSSAPVAAAVAELNNQLPANRALMVHAALANKGRHLSELIDTAGWEYQLAQAPAAEKAALRSGAGLGARAFLAAIPSGKTSMEPAIFIQELRFRLGHA
ncbi:ANK1, partial [Symbiodinium pilosum]